MPRFQSCRLLLLITVVTVGNEAFAQHEAAPSWYLRFRYGGGTPNDAGPLGHCTATFTSDGKVRIESKGRRGVKGPRDTVVYETESLGADKLKSIFKAADTALQEEPFKRRGVSADGNFLRLERSGSQPARVFHNELRGFSEAPPAMQEFVKLLNQLLPSNERIPL